MSRIVSKSSMVVTRVRGGTEQENNSFQISDLKSNDLPSNTWGWFHVYLDYYARHGCAWILCKEEKQAMLEGGMGEEISSEFRRVLSNF